MQLKIVVDDEDKNLFRLRLQVVSKNIDIVEALVAEEGVMTNQICSDEELLYRSYQT